MKKDKEPVKNIVEAREQILGYLKDNSEIIKKFKNGIKNFDLKSKNSISYYSIAMLMTRLICQSTSNIITGIERMLEQNKNDIADFDIISYLDFVKKEIDFMFDNYISDIEKLPHQARD